MKSTHDPNTLWLVLLKNESGAQEVRVWRAPAGRDGLRRIFRVRDEGITPVAATSMALLTRAKMPTEPVSRLQRVMRGGWQAVWINDGGEVPAVLVVQSHTPSTAMRLAQEEGYSPLGAIGLDQVRDALGTMQALLHDTGDSAAQKDLIKHPPRHDIKQGPSPEELAAIAWREHHDVWRRVGQRS